MSTIATEKPADSAADRVLTNRPHVETVLERYRTTIGDDYPGYRNHVYRTITYAMHFLNNNAQHERLVETIFAYHDIGLWTDHELAYLEPSEAVALADNETYQWGLDPVALREGIHWHHKIRPYRGPNPDITSIVEACRKADWVDASLGLVRKGLPAAFIAYVEARFPNCGFHNTLLRLTKDYGGSTLCGTMKVTKGIMRW